MTLHNLYGLLLQASINSTRGEELSIYDSNNKIHCAWSYATLLKDSEIRSAKIQHGKDIVLEKNRVVVLYLEDHQHMISWFWAVIALGGIPCLLPPLTGNEKRNVQLSTLQKLLGNPWFLTSSNLLSDLVSVHDIRTASIDDIDRTSISEDSKIIRPEIPETEGNPAILMLTSGSTGGPKAVSLRYRQIIAALEGKVKIHKTTRDDVFLNFMGLHHVANLMEIHLHALYCGARQFHVEKSAFLNSPLDFLEKVNRHRVSYAFCPNFFLSSLVNALESPGHNKWLKIRRGSDRAAQLGSNSRVSSGIRPPNDFDNPLGAKVYPPEFSKLKRHDISSLRALVSGGEPSLTNTCSKLESLLCEYNVPRNFIKPGFGMTETCAGSIYNVMDCPGYDLARKSGFVNVGVCMPGIKVRVMRQDGTEANDNETGSLQLSGPVVFKEYFNSPTETANSFTNDGWFKSRDLASLDENGRLYFCGRENDTIVSNGYGRLFLCFFQRRGRLTLPGSNIHRTRSKQ